MSHSMTHYTVQLISPTSSISGIFTYDDANDACELVLSFDGKQIFGSASDYFDSLRMIRNQLDKERLKPVCYGASRNCFPSNMSRDMGSGLQIYKLEIGKQAATSDIVSIFSSGPDVEAVTVAEQEDFYREWIASLGI